MASASWASLARLTLPLILLGGCSDSPTASGDGPVQILDRGAPQETGVADASAGDGSLPPSDGSSDKSIPAPDQRGDGPPPVTGQITQWKVLSPMPVPRANHCMAVVENKLVVIGGNYRNGADLVELDAVHTAAPQPDGSLGQWRHACTTRSAVTACSAAGRQSWIIVSGGTYADPDHENKVWQTVFTPDGSCNNFYSLGPLPADWGSLGPSFVRNQTLYLPGGKFGTGSDLVGVAHASLASGLGSWTVDTLLPAYRARPQYGPTASHLYVMGGYLPITLEVSAGGAAAPFLPSGDLGMAFGVLQLPAPTMAGALVAVDNVLILIGGTSQLAGDAVATVYASKTAQDGSLGPWVKQASLPEPRQGFTAAVVGDYLYVVGGADTAGGLATVFSARVRY